jgi:hypothetical protein
VENVAVDNYVTQFRTWTTLSELYIDVNVSQSSTNFTIEVFDLDGSSLLNGTGTTGDVCYQTCFTSDVM